MKKKVFTLLFASMMSITSIASAAVPNNSIVIGTKGYSLDYLVNPSNTTEINGALSDMGDGKIFYNIEGVTAGFNELFDNRPATALEIQQFPRIEYKNSNGGIEVYAPGNGDREDNPQGEDFEVVDIQ